MHQTSFLLRHASTKKHEIVKMQYYNQMMILSKTSVPIVRISKAMLHFAFQHLTGLRFCCCFQCRRANAWPEETYKFSVSLEKNWIGLTVTYIVFMEESNNTAAIKFMNNQLKIWTKTTKKSSIWISKILHTFRAIFNLSVKVNSIFAFWMNCSPT